MKTRYGILVCLMVSLVTPISHGQTTTSSSEAAGARPMRVLFVGNSLSFASLGVFYRMQKLTESSTPPIPFEEDNVMVPNASLSSILNEGSALKFIQNGNYDVVVLQESLFDKMDTVEQFSASCSVFVTEIKNKGGRAILFMQWNFPFNPSLSWITMESIVQAHNTVSHLVGAEVSPVGLAWQEARKRMPSMDLFDSDRLHPNVKGSYLSACTLFASIFKVSPAGLSYTAGLDKEVASFLQKLAWETVSTYSQ